MPTRPAYQKYELCIYGVSATLLSYVRRICAVLTVYRTFQRRSTNFKCTHKNIAPQRMKSMSSVRKGC